MTPDERDLLLLLAKMVAGQYRSEKQLRAAIARIEESESRKRDEFVNGFMKGTSRVHD